MLDKKVRQVYRLCPCDKSNVEGIQSWLEDLAAEGLFLTDDGEFCGVFTFERQPPRQAAYRLDVAQKRKLRFLDSGDELTDEEVELYRSMGWEYLARYGDFRIYRSMDRDAPELNTESQTHAMTIRLLKKKHRSSFVSGILTALFWMLWSRGFLRYGYRLMAVVGVVFTLCVYGFMLWNVVVPLVRAFRYRRYEKRLLSGDSLSRRMEWKKNAALSVAVRVLPLLLCLGIAGGFFSTLAHAGKELPHQDYPGDPPFATVADVFPGCTVSREDAWLDYGIYTASETAVSKNVEWNENCDVVSAEGERYFCILRVAYHETASEWLARGLEEDYYVYDATRYHGKRFSDLEAPELGVDSVRVYNNYGSLTVLMRQGNRVVHAVVVMDDGDNHNQWILWAEAMAQMLKQEF